MVGMVIRIRDALTHAAPCVVFRAVEAVAALAVPVIPGLPSPQTAAALARAPRQTARAYGPFRTAVALTQPSHLAEPCVGALDPAL
jgi:hypothetical protein